MLFCYALLWIIFFKNPHFYKNPLKSIFYDNLGITVFFVMPFNNNNIFCYAFFYKNFYSKIIFNEGITKNITVFVMLVMRYRSLILKGFYLLQEKA
jgi:hypothetical protein